MIQWPKHQATLQFSDTILLYYIGIESRVWTRSLTVSRVSGISIQSDREVVHPRMRWIDFWNEGFRILTWVQLTAYSLLSHPYSSYSYSSQRAECSTHRDVYIRETTTWFWLLWTSPNIYFLKPYHHPTECFMPPFLLKITPITYSSYV